MLTKMTTETVAKIKTAQQSAMPEHPSPEEKNALVALVADDTYPPEMARRALEYHGLVTVQASSRYGEVTCLQVRPTKKGYAVALEWAELGAMLDDKKGEAQ